MEGRSISVADAAAKSQGSAPMNPLPSTVNAEQRRQAGRVWIWMLVSSILLIVLGLIATSALALSGAFFVVLLGWLAIGGGVIQIVGAFLFRNFSGFTAEIFLGVISIVLGLVMLNAPVLVGSLIALILVIGFIADAVLSGLHAFVLRHPGWVMALLIALLSIALGVVIILNPSLLLSLLGLLVAANLFVRGVVLFLAALEVRSLSRR
jgi:uncharacterized membrane protein HdeD (DUF308 family)